MPLTFKKELVHLFAQLFLAFGAEFLERVGTGTAGWRKQMALLLPPDVRTRFLRKRRCSVSWLTDAATLNLAASVLHANLDGPDLLFGGF